MRKSRKFASKVEIQYICVYLCCIKYVIFCNWIVITNLLFIYLDIYSLGFFTFQKLPCIPVFHYHHLANLLVICSAFFSIFVFYSHVAGYYSWATWLDMTVSSIHAFSSLTLIFLLLSLSQSSPRPPFYIFTPEVNILPTIVWRIFVLNEFSFLIVPCS